MSKIICCFCKKEGERAKEHIWPKWLQLELNSSTKKPHIGVHISVKGSHVISKRNQTGETLVFGKVCKKCNNGWMSNLEGQFKPIFLQLQKDNNLNSLSKSSRKLIADWSLKTAIMINAGSNYRKIIPLIHYDHLYKYKSLPRDVVIDLGFINSTEKLGWQQSNINGIILKQSKFNEEKQAYSISDRSYVITMQLNRLGIKVQYFENCKQRGYCVPLNQENRLLRIWPYRKNSNINFSLAYENIESMHADTLLKQKTS